MQLELVKHLSNSLKFDQDDENDTLLGNNELTEKIDKALKSLDLHHRASILLEEVANEFKVPVELIKVEDIIDGNNSVVWQQAYNRVHAQKSIINWCLN